MAHDVHWEEGLFLRPQHLQMMQRGFGRRIESARSTWCSYPWGLIRMDLARDELANGWFRLHHLSAVTRNGVVVDHPGGAALDRLHLTPLLEQSSGRGLVIHLAVPVYADQQSNVTEGASLDERRLWRIDEVEDVSDENTGRDVDVKVPVRVRRVNAKLLALPDGQEPNDSGFETLPLGRVEQIGSGEGVGQPRLDETFFPPCMVLGGSPSLHRLVERITNLIGTAWTESSSSLIPSGGSVESLRGEQLVRLLRSLVLGRYAAWLPGIVRQGGASEPLEICQHLRSFVAEMGTLLGEVDILSGVPAYDHLRPHGAFCALERCVDQVLQQGSSAKPGWDSVPFEHRDGMLMAALTDDHFKRGVSFYLGIRSPEEPRSLAAQVEDENTFRLLSLTMRSAFFGVKLVKQWDPPSAFPGGADRHYFDMRISDGQSQLVWERVQKDGGVKIDWEGSLEPSQVALYMTVSD